MPGLIRCFSRVVGPVSAHTQWGIIVRPFIGDLVAFDRMGGAFPGVSAGRLQGCADNAAIVLTEVYGWPHCVGELGPP